MLNKGRYKPTGWPWPHKPQNLEALKSFEQNGPGSSAPMDKRRYFVVGKALIVYDEPVLDQVHPFLGTTIRQNIEQEQANGC